MVKEKKGKKGGKEVEEELGDEFDTEKSSKLEPMSKSKKKERKKKNDDWEEDVAAEIATMAGKDKAETADTEEPVETKKQKKKTRKADKDQDSKVNDNIESGDEDRPDNLETSRKSSNSSTQNESSGKAKSKLTTKSKKSKAKADDSDDDDDVGDVSRKSKVNDETMAPKKKVNKPKSMFELLADEGSDVDMGGSDDEATEEKQEEKKEPATKQPEPKKGKKSKKEAKRKDEEEEIERMLAEIELGGKAKTKEEPKPKEEVKEPMEVVEGGLTIVTEIPDEDDDVDKQTKKKKKKAVEEKETAEGEEKEVEEEGTVKTAAQKKKEKKEREKQKKLAQKAQEKTKKPKDEAEVTDASKEGKEADKDVKPVVLEDTPTEAAPSVAEEEESKLGAEGDEGKKKTDKKKKKVEKEKGEKDKKGPGKKQILAMQEALKKLKEEEEKRRLEEEAKERAAQEAEVLRQEKIRLEQERKEKKKLKEKEKRERLKAEGKLLTQSQRQQRARAQAMLEALRAQGLDVPKIGEKKEKPFRPGDRVRSKKNKQAEAVKEDTPESMTESIPDVGEAVVDDGPVVENEDKKEPEELSEPNSEESVKDAWDESSGESEDESMQTEEDAAKVKVDGRKESETKDSTKESESESSEDSGSESDDESESESEADERDQSHSIGSRERALCRIQKRREDNEKNRKMDKLRSPVVCVLGHVDTGKTKILDQIRHTHVQDCEAGGITQQIGATMIPVDAINEQAKMVKGFSNIDLKIPGLLIIDTPGHESFSNLRSRGSSLCDIAILVVDIMHGIEPQTLESINLLKQKKTPFVVALNKVDRLYDWKTCKNKDIQDTLKAQNRNTMLEFEDRVKIVVGQFAEQGLNAALCYDNKDPRTYISLVPTSALSSDGMGNLIALVVELTQSMMAKRLAFTEELQATVLEVKAIPGLGTTIDVILVNGRLKEGDTMILAGIDGPLVTQIRSLLMPQPLKELRVKNFYQEFKEVEGAQGVKVAGKDLEKAIAGLNVLIAHHPDETDICKEEVAKELHAAMSSIKLAERGVYVQASTLGSLEALLEFLTSSKIPYSGIRIGPVVKKDVMKASVMLEHDNQYAVILAFDVKIERDAQELADSLGVKIFAADIIYHLFDKFMAYQDELKHKKREQFKHIAVFPCRLRILPQFIFNTRDPIVVGVSVEAGVVREGTPLCVPSKEFLDIGIVTTIEVNHKPIECARKGQEVCIKIEPASGETPKLYGRHFDFSDQLVSKISRQSIDACKDYFRDDLQKSDWQLMVDLKKLFKIM